MENRKSAMITTWDEITIILPTEENISEFKDISRNYPR